MTISLPRIGMNGCAAEERLFRRTLFGLRAMKRLPQRSPLTNLFSVAGQFVLPPHVRQVINSSITTKGPYAPTI